VKARRLYQERQQIGWRVVVRVAVVIGIGIRILIGIEMEEVMTMTLRAKVATVPRRKARRNFSVLSERVG
tara:strand:- start:284 stop:493 length:210 start_codon:yes stop_codon:yes gene_type:complete